MRALLRLDEAGVKKRCSDNIMRLSRYELLSSFGGEYAIEFGQGEYELLSSTGTVHCSTAVLIVSHYCPSSVLQMSL
jgi:hypothetical protein